MSGNPGLDEGRISGEVTVLGDPAERTVIALSYEPFDLAGSDDGSGNPIKVRQVVGASRSGADGAYQIDLGNFTGEVIVIALDDYGQRWTPNTAYSVGTIIRPTQGNETGYVYRCTVPGVSFPTEPLWWINTGGDNTGDVGTATFEALESWWPITHAPVAPEVIAYDGILLDAYYNDTVLITHCEPHELDTLLDDKWEQNVVHITGDVLDSPNGIDPHNDAPTELAFTRHGNATYDGSQKAYPEHTTSWYFDGAGSYLRSAVASNAWSMHHSKMSVEFWVRHNDKNGLQYLVSNRNINGLTNLWVIEMTSTKEIAFVWWNSGGVQGGYIKTTTKMTAANVWHHYLLQVDGQACSLWMDGIFDKTVVAINKPAGIARELYIARDQFTQPARDFKGWLADIRITQEHRQTPGVDFTPPAAPLPKQYSTRQDNFVNIISNTMEAGFQRAARVDNDPAKALYGDGYWRSFDSYIDILSNTTDQLLYFGTGDYTLEWAIYFEALSDNTTVLSSGFNGVINGPRIHHANGNALQITIGGIYRFDTAAVSIGEWIRMAYSRKDGVTRFFLDGTQQGTDINDGSNLLLQQLRLLADSDGSKRSEARVDEIRITKAGRYTDDYIPDAGPFPDTKFQIAPSETAVYTWQDATINNHLFESGLDFWIADNFGSEPDQLVTDSQTRDPGEPGSTVGFYGGANNRGASHHQDIPVPAGTLLCNFRVWLEHTYADNDAAYAYIVFLDDQGARIDGYGAFHRTHTGGVGGEPNATEAGLFETTCLVPPDADTARIYIGACRDISATNLNAGGDNIRVRWGMETQHDGYWPTGEKLPIVNEDFWLGSAAGWTLSSNGTDPSITSNSGYASRAGYALYGSSNASESWAEQTVSLPAGTYTWAEIKFQSKSNAQDPDQCQLEVEFLNVNDAVIGTAEADGAKCTDANFTNSSVWVELPAGTDKIKLTIHYARENGAALNVAADWVQVNLYDLATPQIEALTPND